jgi:hypothetical protein
MRALTVLTFNNGNSLVGLGITYIYFLSIFDTENARGPSGS